MSNPIFLDSGTIKFPMFDTRIVGTDNIVLRPALPHTTLTVGTLYAIHPGITGNVTAALADNALVYRVGVALEAAVTSTTKVTWLQTGGYYAGMTTPTLSVSAGHTLGILDGAIADDGAAVPIRHYSFAINVTATTSATSHNVILLDREVRAST